MNRLALPVLAIGLTACGGPTYGGPPAPRPDPRFELFADSVLAGYSGSVPGAAVLVMDHGEARLAKGYGLADAARGRRVSPTTAFRLASLTKQFTATAVLLLVQDGKLRLADSLGGIFPALPPRLRPITIRQLLNHTSGLVDYEDLIPDGMVLPLKDADVLRLLQTRDSLQFEPGSAYAYSNSGYVVLALVVERVSGLRFPVFLRDRIFTPLAMIGTVAYEEGLSRVADRALGHSRQGAGWIETDQSLTSRVLGDGGIYTTVEDLERWYASVSRRTLLRGELYDEMFTAPRLADGKASEYGFGWFLTPWQGRRATRHHGSTIGFRNAVLRLPDQDITVVVLTNRNEGEPMALADSLAGRLVNPPNPNP
jgi:CubicO group peptidase (beta-lactamase class C family)